MQTTPNRKRSVSGDPNNSEAAVYGLGSFVPADGLKSQVGDLIEIDRTLYSDWALDDGDGYVIHVSGAKGEDIPTDAKGIVRRDKLTDVAKFNAVRVNNKSVCAKERSLQPLPLRETLTKARNAVGSPVNFDFFKNNSEFYLTLWKFGYGWSDQASMAINVIKSLGCNRNSGQQLLESLTAILQTPPSSDPYGHLYRDRKRRSSSTPPVILLSPNAIIPGPVIPKYNSSSRPNSGRTTPRNTAA